MSLIVTLPEHWASALINGDTSGLDLRERLLCSLARADLARDGLHIVDIARDPDTNEANEPRFSWHYRMYSRDRSADAPTGGMVLDYVAVAGRSARLWPSSTSMSSM
jgi:hypothetical protein